MVTLVPAISERTARAIEIHDDPLAVAGGSLGGGALAKQPRQAMVLRGLLQFT